jgi:hypothetical protein
MKGPLGPLSQTLVEKKKSSTPKEPPLPPPVNRHHQNAHLAAAARPMSFSQLVLAMFFASEIIFSSIGFVTVFFQAE